MKRRSKISSFSLFAFQDIITSICGIVVLITLILALELSLRVIAKPQGMEMASREVFDQMVVEANKLQEQLEKSRVTLSELQSSGPEESLQYTRAELEAHVAAETQSLAANQSALEASQTKLDNATNRRTRALLIEDSNEKAKREQSVLQQKKKDLVQQNAAIVAKINEWKQPRGKYFGRVDSDVQFPWLLEFVDHKLTAVSLSKNSSEEKIFDEGSSFSTAHSFIQWVKTRTLENEYFIFMVRPSGTELYSALSNIIPYEMEYGVKLIAENEPVELME